MHKIQEVKWDYTGIDSMYYIHPDHLGSYCAITDDLQQVRQYNRFDLFGNAIDTIWQTSFTLTSCGYLFSTPLIPRRRGRYVFSSSYLIPSTSYLNMNGRLYDPVIGRFFSPDNFVQNPFFTQNFNRYSYALNNPLRYKDPTGQWYEDDYGDYDWDDDEDGGRPKNPCNCQGNYSHVYGDVSMKERDDYLSDYDDRDEDPRGDENDPNNWFEPFDYSGQDELDNDPPNSPAGKGGQLSHGFSNTSGLVGTVWGGGAATAAAETAAEIGKWTSSLKYMKIGGNILGAVGTGMTAWNTIVKRNNGTDNTADYVDLGASALLLGFGLILTNPIGIGIIVGIGMGYGIYRLSAGEKADVWINDNFGFRP